MTMDTGMKSSPSLKSPLLLGHPDNKRIQNSNNDLKLAKDAVPENTIGASQGKPDKDDGSMTATINSVQLAINLINLCFGVGVFSLPWSLAGASLIPGISITLGVLIVNYWTNMIVVEAAERKQIFEFGELLGSIPGSLGPILQTFYVTVNWLSCYIVLIMYLGVMADSALPYVAGTMIYDRSVLVTLFAIMLTPVCFLDMKYLSFTSALSVIVTVSIFFIVVQTLIERPLVDDLLVPTPCMFGLSLGSVTMFSAMMQAVVIQTVVVPMYGQLENRSVRKFRNVLRFSFGFLFLFLMSFAIGLCFFRS